MTDERKKLIPDPGPERAQPPPRKSHCKDHAVCKNKECKGCPRCNTCKCGLFVKI